MKNFLSIFSTENLKRNLINIISRFPIGLLIIILVNILFFSQLHGDFSKNIDHNIIKSIFSLIITFFFSVGVYITGENYGFNKIKRNIYQIIPIIFGVLFFLGFTSDLASFENFIFAIICLVGIISYLFFAPYIKNIIKKSIKQNIYYTYFYKISVIFLMSAILGGLLSVLGSIGIISITKLFDINYSQIDKIYQDWIILALAFFPPIFALTQLPEKKTYGENYFNENVFFSFLIKYIVTPFIYIYFIILYAYTIKVLANFGDWPKGEVSWIVIGFSTLGYITYIFSYIFEAKNKFIKIFRKAFPYVVLPQLFMLFYAIYLRINQYDITINRYFVVVFGVWLAVISLYFIISKKKSLASIPLILALFTIIISIGPWSVYNFSETRQLIRLENNLKKASILQNSKIIPLENYSDIDKELSRDIYSGIKYLCDFDNCEKIKQLFPKQYKKLEEKHKKEFEENKQRDLENYKDNEDMKKKVEKRIYNPPHKWEIVKFITKELKVKIYYKNDYIREVIHIYNNGNDDIFPLEIKGYKKILRIGNYNKNSSKTYAKIDYKNKKLIIVNLGKEEKIINIENIFSEIEKNYKEKGSQGFSKDDLTYEIENYKIVFQNISIKNPEYKGNKVNFYYNFNGYLLVK